MKKLSEQENNPRVKVNTDNQDSKKAKPEEDILLEFGAIFQIEDLLVKLGKLEDDIVILDDGPEKQALSREISDIYKTFQNIGTLQDEMGMLYAPKPKKEKVPLPGRQTSAPTTSHSSSSSVTFFQTSQHIIPQAQMAQLESCRQLLQGELNSSGYAPDQKAQQVEFDTMHSILSTISHIDELLSQCPVEKIPVTRFIK